MEQTSGTLTTDQPLHKLHNNLIKYMIKNPVQKKMQEKLDIAWDHYNVDVDFNVFKEITQKKLSHNRCTS